MKRKTKRTQQSIDNLRLPLNWNTLTSEVQQTYLSLIESGGKSAAKRYLKLITSKKFQTRKDNESSRKLKELSEAQIKRIQSRHTEFKKKGCNAGYCCVCLDEISVDSLYSIFCSERCRQVFIGISKKTK